MSERIERIRQAIEADYEHGGYDETGYRNDGDERGDICFLDDMQTLLAALDEAMERIEKTELRVMEIELVAPHSYAIAHVQPLLRILEGENPGLRCVYKGKNTKALDDFFKATED